ncbi:hypothetical protein J4E81_006560 [Alternaria sp. BMP 2799]|nr:hypothetical protein J4E81_006560 [Alternaria sp. BMP 2799]
MPEQIPTGSHEEEHKPLRSEKRRERKTIPGLPPSRLEVHREAEPNLEPPLPNISPPVYTTKVSSSKDPSGSSAKDREEPYLLASLFSSLSGDWRYVQKLLPEAWQWDIEYASYYADSDNQHGCWTCTPVEADEPRDFPLTIASAPVVLPVEYRWPPIGGSTSPPDPRSEAPIDCRAPVALELVRDVFLTFEGSIGFYLLINGLLQIIVPVEFDTAWASSHLPQRYGGLKVCYIEQILEPTTLPTRTETTGGTLDESSRVSLGTLRSASAVRASAQSPAYGPSLKCNDLIEARPNHNPNETFSGLIGLKVGRHGSPYILMSTHVITEAILARSRRNLLRGRKRGDRVKKLEDDWNEHVEIWAAGGKCGTIHQSFDPEAEIYPNGFKYDVTIIKPVKKMRREDVVSPITGLGWLDRDSWVSLRQQTTTIKILADDERSQSAKTIKCSGPSDIVVVGEGIFLNQKAAAGDAKSVKHHDEATWKDLVSRAVLYRVYPDFDSPNGHSGTVLYANGTRTDGTEGPGVVGFQSFVQRSGHVQNFEMEGDALERRLRAGRVAFYGAFEVPAELKKYHIY